MKLGVKWAAVAALAFASAAGTARAAIVINEVYSGGGSSSPSAAHKTDFVELFNNGTSDVELFGFKLEYSPSSRANGVFDVAIGTLPAGAKIAAGGTYLVQTGSSGAGGGADVFPDVDFNSGASLSATAGAVRLTDGTNPLDILGWGNLTNGNFETTAETAPADVTVSMQRAVPGVDTNDNQTDFIQVAPTAAASPFVPEPSALAVCGAGVVIGMRRRRGRA